MKKDLIEIVEDLANELLYLMGTKAKASASEDKENLTIKVEIETDEETGLLIGSHGATLTAIQYFLGLAYKQKTGEWVRVVVDLAGYRSKQEERLTELAYQVAERAKVTGEPQPLYNLSSQQRRLVHVTLSMDPDITTESYGEGEERYLVVRLKPKKGETSP